MDISPVIIVKDAEQTIAKTLESLKEFEEVIAENVTENTYQRHLMRVFADVTR